jgi:DNA-binding response OmpR family regulator
VPPIAVRGTNVQIARYAGERKQGGHAPYMLFAKRERSIRRILIVEDEPLVAFDNEHMLKDDDYEVVATVDSYADAAEAIEANEIDLVMTDLSLAGEGTGVDVARAARAKGVHVLFVTAHYCAEDAKALALGCLAKPYSERALLAALEAVDRHIQGQKPKRRPKQLTLYTSSAS